MQYSKTCAIVSGGSYCAIDGQYQYIIACDHGLDHCNACGVVPDVVMGDMDSVTSSMPTTAVCMRYNSDKDDTDTMLAVRYAIAQGYNSIDILCATGGRIDHMLANIQCLVYAVIQGVSCKVVDDSNIVWATNSSLDVAKRQGYSLSLLSHSDSCIVSVSGTQYTLDHHTLTNNVPLGVSNVITDVAHIVVHSGMLLVIESRIL